MVGKKSEVLDSIDQKSEEISSSSGDSLVDYEEEDIRLFNEEYERSGDCDFDFTRVGRHVGFRPVNFKDCDFSEEPMEMGTYLEFVRAVRANWNLGAGITFCISFEAKDASDHIDHPIPFQARVRYFLKEIIVGDVKPKP